MIYLDSCALLKMIKIEPDHRALADYLNGHRTTPIVSSELLAVEVRRALGRYRDDELEPAEYPRLADGVIGVMDLVPISVVRAAAGTIPPPSIRSLDAIHLATAVFLDEALTAFITYDKRLEEAAAAHELPVVVPRDG